MKKERPKDINTDFSKFTDINLKTSYLIVIVRYYMEKNIYILTLRTIIFYVA